MTRFETIVLGLGAMGSATACHLARRGNRVLGIDRFSPPHVFGSTHGDTRITRLAIGEGEQYTPLALRSHELWRELERETGASLMTCNGGLVISSAAKTVDQPRRELLREHGRGSAPVRDRARASRRSGDSPALSRFQRRRRRIRLFRAERGLRPAGGLRRRASRRCARPRRDPPARRDRPRVRHLGRGGHGDDGEGRLSRRPTDRDGRRVAAGPRRGAKSRGISRCIGRRSSGSTLPGR